MSVVYLAQHLRLGRKRALKLLASTLAQDPEARGRFEEEWKLAASIEHPAIVEVFDAGEYEGQLYIVMRYVLGGDLSRLVERAGQLDPARAVRLLEPVGAALDAAHALGLVHRDIKPGNILVAEGDRAYLSDFGIAKFSAAPAGRTRAGLFIGTVDYAAPEQVEDLPVDARTDVYALGAVLYYCLTGKPPFQGESEAQVMMAHLLEPQPRPGALRPDLPASLDQVVTQAMAKSPQDRFQTAGSLVSAAQAALRRPHSDHTVLAPPSAQPAPGATVASEAMQTSGARTRLPRSETELSPAPPLPAPVDAAAPPTVAPPPATPAPPSPPPPVPRAASARRFALRGAALGLAGFAAFVGIGVLIWFVALKPSAKPGVTPPPADTVPPRLTSASANSQGVIALSYGERLDPASVPSAGAFSIDTGAGQRSPRAVAIRGSEAVLTTGIPLAGKRVRLAYTRPTTGGIADLAGNLAPALANVAVRTPSLAAPPPPALAAAEAKDDVVSARFTLPLDASSIPDATAFQVEVDKKPIVPTNVTVSGSSLTLSLVGQAAGAAPIRAGSQQIRLSYNPPGDHGLRGLSGRPVASFSRRIDNRTYSPPGYPHPKTGMSLSVCGSANTNNGSCANPSRCCPWFRNHTSRQFAVLLQLQDSLADDRVDLRLVDTHTNQNFVRPSHFRVYRTRPKGYLALTVTGGPFRRGTSLFIGVTYNGNTIRFQHYPRIVFR